MNTSNMSYWHVGYFDKKGVFWSLSEYNCKKYAEEKLKYLSISNDEKYVIMEKQITWVNHSEQCG